MQNEEGAVGMGARRKTNVGWQGWENQGDFDNDQNRVIARQPNVGFFGANSSINENFDVKTQQQPFSIQPQHEEEKLTLSEFQLNFDNLSPDEKEFYPTSNEMQLLIKSFMETKKQSKIDEKLKNSTLIDDADKDKEN